MHAARALAVIALVVALLGGAAPARAADEIGVSVDGVTWHDRLTAALFIEPGLWVPGDARTRSFWVRNRAGDPAGLVVSVHAADPHGAVARGDLVIEVRTDGGPWVAAVGGVPVPTAGAVAAGATVRVDVRVTAPWTATNASQGDAASLRLAVALAQGSPPAGDASPGGLAVTGATAAHAAVWTAAVLVGVGAALLRSRTPRRSGDDRGEA